MILFLVRSYCSSFSYNWHHMDLVLSDWSEHWFNKICRLKWEFRSLIAWRKKFRFTKGRTSITYHLKNLTRESCKALQVRCSSVWLKWHKESRKINDREKTFRCHDKTVNHFDFDSCILHSNSWLINIYWSWSLLLFCVANVIKCSLPKLSLQIYVWWCGIPI